MNELTKLKKLKIIIEVNDDLLGKKYHILICQKCNGRAKIRNINELPKVCSQCKCSPYTGPGQKGRPKK